MSRKRRVQRDEAKRKQLLPAKLKQQRKSILDGWQAAQEQAFLKAATGGTISDRLGVVGAAMQAKKQATVEQALRETGTGADSSWSEQTHKEQPRP
jgi:hypothetical protein